MLTDALRPMLRAASLLSLALLSLSAVAQSGAAAPAPDLPTVLREWRGAVHAPARPKAVYLARSSDEDSLPGKRDEWLTERGQYRLLQDRGLDNTELVATTTAAWLRDWNGYVRDIQGQMLKRLRTEILEDRTLLFGPDPAAFAGAQVSEDDAGRIVLQVAPAGASPITWYLDKKTWLPAKSVRPGDDTEITTTYSDWRDSSGVLLPYQESIAETEKPDRHLVLGQVTYGASVPTASLRRPKPGPADAFFTQPGAHQSPPIPFNFENNHIMIQTVLNGRPPIWFLLDTGANESIVNTPRLAGFGVKPYGKTATTGGGGTADYGYATGATFSMPGIEVRDQHIGVIDCSGIERVLGMPLGGLLGYEFISRFVIEIDYPSLTLTLHDPAGWKYTGSGYIVPLVFDEGIPFTDATISVPTKPDIPAYMVVDFGAAATATLTSAYVKDNNLLELARANSQVARTPGSEGQFFAQANLRGQLDRLALGSLHIDNVPVNLSANTQGAYASKTFAGTIGETIFRRFHVYLDYARNRMILEPNADFTKPYPPPMTYGLSLVASGPDLKTFTVASVRKGSPAEKDGFKKGDVIAAVDGKPAAGLTLGALREQLAQAGKHYEMTVNRGGAESRLPITVELIASDR